MRLPNGYGSITKLSGKRRKPFMVRITTGYDNEGKQLMSVLGYYTTRNEALAMLAEYNKNPYNPIARKTTFKEIYESFCNEKYISKDIKIPHAYTSSFAWCTPVHYMAFPDIKLSAMQKIVDDCNKSRATKKNIKILFNRLSNYCLANDVIDKNYASLIELPPDIKSEVHKPFTTEELNMLWLHADDINIQIVLILCYTGMRPTELMTLKHSNVHLDERYMLGGIKTKAGKDRVIPIAQKIFPFIKRLYEQNNDYLLTYENKKVEYDTFRRKLFAPAMKLVELKHYPHDGRHTCATLLDNAQVPDKIIKKILGHATTDITEKVYTHKAIRQLVDAINQI